MQIHEIKMKIHVNDEYKERLEKRPWLIEQGQSRCAIGGYLDVRIGPHILYAENDSTELDGNYMEGDLEPTIQHLLSACVAFVSTEIQEVWVELMDRGLNFIITKLDINDLTLQVKASFPIDSKITFASYKVTLASLLKETIDISKNYINSLEKFIQKDNRLLKLTIMNDDLLERIRIIESSETYQKLVG